MRKPDFVGVGFQRCASSWIQLCLNEHPDVGKQPMGIHYFSEELDRGDDWYMGQFAGFEERPTLLDLSVSYTYPGNVAQASKEIARLLPEAKIFACVREPVARAHSDYRRSLFRQELSPGTPFEEAIEQHPDLIDRGKYGRLLATVLDHVEGDRLRIFFYDDVVADPAGFWRDLCGFLGIDAGVSPSVLQDRINHLAAPRAPGVIRTLRGAHRRLIEVPGFGQAWKSLRRSRLWHRAAGLAVGKEECVHADTEARLKDLFVDDIEFLETLTRRDLTHWKHGEPD